MNEHFEADWLSLREAADAASRSRDLTDRAARWLSQRRSPYRLVDLGAGGGNNTAWLAPRLPGPQRWRLVDHDRGLLERAEARLAGLSDAETRKASVDCVHVDLADLEAAVPDGTDLALASALFDLASADWVEALATRCAAVGCAALWTLTVDGEWRFVDPDGASVEDAADVAMRARLQEHQYRDKGMGAALGGRAPGLLAAAFESRGYGVHRAPSPWRLNAAGNRALALELMAGWRRALLEQSPGNGDGEEIHAWWSRRREAVVHGELGIEVGHVDVWAEPST